MKWLRPTITRKFLLLLIGFFALQILQLGLGVYGVLRIGDEGAVINAASEQRLRTLLLGNLAQRVVESRAPAGEVRDALRQGIQEYERVLTELDGVVARYPGSPSPALALIPVRESWQRELRPLLEEIARTGAAGVLSRYDALAQSQLERVNQVAQILESRVRDDTRRLALWQTLIVALSVSFGIVALFMARHIVAQPLRRFTDATRAIAGGAYDRRVEVLSDDELGDLARTFNRMARTVGDKATRLQALNEVALAVISSLGLQDILDQIMMQGMRLTGACGACVAFYDIATQRFNQWVTRGLSDRYVEQMTFGPGAAGEEVMRLGTHVLKSARSGAAAQLSEAARAEGIRLLISLPLVSGSQRMGVINFYYSDRDEFESEEIDLIKTFSYLAAHAIQNAQLHARTVDLAETDDLTGLYNRRKFRQRLREEVQRVQRSHRPLALLLLDIDHFKNVNDTYGHPAGDFVLKSLATVFRRELRDIDVAARTGGEEFMFLLPETDTEGARRAAERIRLAVAAETIVLADGTRVQLTVSLGAACCPQDTASPEELITRADQAMYAAKRAGRNRSVLYAESVGSGVRG